MATGTTRKTKLDPCHLVNIGQCSYFGIRHYLGGIVPGYEFLGGRTTQEYDGRFE
jgi:hypothetical protein